MKQVSERVTESHEHVDKSTGFIFNDTNFINRKESKKELKESRRKNMKAMVNTEIQDRQDKKEPIKKDAKRISKPPLPEKIQDIDLDEDDWETIEDPNNVEGKNQTKAKPESVDDLDNLDAIPLVKKSAVDLKAIKMKDDRSLPPIIGASINFDELNNWLALLDTEQKRERIIIYVYRTLPVINRQLTDSNASISIDVLKGEPINRADFIATHGGGKYKFLVNDLERNRGSKTSNGTIYTVWYEVPFSEYMPIIKWDELELAHKANKGFITWCQGKGILDGQGRYIGDQMNTQQVGQARSIAGASTQESSFANKLLDNLLQQNMNGGTNKRANLEENATTQAIRIVADTASKQMDVLVNTLKGNGSNDKDTLTGLAAILTPLLAARVDPNQLSMKDLMVMMQAQSDSQMKMMLLLMEANKPKESNSKISDLKDLIAVAKELTGGANASASLTDRALDIVSENAGPLLSVISNMMNMNKGAVPTAANIPTAAPDFLTQAQMPHVLPTQAQMQSAIPQTQPINSQVIQGIQGNGVDMNFDPEVIQLKQVLAMNGATIINAMAQNLTGDIFADSLIAMYGRPTYMMIAKCGKDKLLTAMKGVPEFWNGSAGVYGEPLVIQFIADFMNHDAIVNAEQAEDLASGADLNSGKIVDIQSPGVQTDKPATDISDKLAAMNRS